MNREVEEATDQAMTTRHLISHLLSLDPGADEKGGNARILFISDYGDRSHTQQALPVAEAESYCTSNLAETGYSQSGICLKDEPSELTDNDCSVILLQS